ncbi:rab-protein geranylgeranyltransferase [Lentinus tigrinus ALCF2SS1-7]|uniref:rab-protein geranylgeranyltransferase n=1 Tax=Lentinus tigrinus ALCF2SS1-7 TaxID=1328758 RepID=UPI001165FA8A|nr:rab-protein geranylgeranyltransferase [Lentinus tigrinus ALCF2SS1-7]
MVMQLQDISILSTENKERELAKLKEFQGLTAEVLDRKKRKDHGRESFDLTTRLLHVNPEFYTIWNYRRLILLDGVFPTSTPTQTNEILSDDLSLTTTLLKQHPKVYWIWNHRQWCLRQVPDGPTDTDPNGWRQSYWNKELFVVEKMLEVDPRNFHAWNYRRHVLDNMPVKRTELSELAYTKRKIEANFSNFSAWHQRSKVLTSLWSAGKLDKPKSIEEELDLVKNAMYTDPGDQSVWIYHRWLISLGDSKNVVDREILSIDELLDEQPDSKWCMESLVFYKRLLLRKYSESLTDEERWKLGSDCEGLLAKLQRVDPDRKQRYIDLSGHSV